MLTVREAALRARVSASLIYAWCADGILAHARVGRANKRGHIRIAIEDLDGVLAGFKVKVTSGRGTNSKSHHLPLKHIKL